MNRSSSPSKYQRVKALGRLLLKGEGDGRKERIVLYDRTTLVAFVTFVIGLEMIKNFWFASSHLSIELRILYGDIIISSKEDQRLMNFVLGIVYFFILVYFYFYFFDKQKMRHYELSKFLLVLDNDHYSRRFGVTRAFAERFAKQMNLLVRLNQLMIYGYIFITFSYYLTTVGLAISFGFSLEQILTYSFPSTLSGGLAFVYSYTVAIQCFSFFCLYVKLLNARVARLTAELDELDGRSSRQKTLDHLVRLELLVKEFKTSQSYFERSLASFVPAILLIIALFPSILVVSGQFFTNRLNGLFLLDLILIVIPIKYNEKLKRQVCSFKFFKSEKVGLLKLLRTSNNVCIRSSADSLP